MFIYVFKKYATGIHVFFYPNFLIFLLSDKIVFRVIHYCRKTCFHIIKFELIIVSTDIVCELPDAILHGHYEISDDNMMITYECDIGYSMNGTNTRVCGSDGSGWSLQAPSCCK
jgi:hypothetical protein